MRTPPNNWNLKYSTEMKWTLNMLSHVCLSLVVPVLWILGGNETKLRVSKCRCKMLTDGSIFNLCLFMISQTILFLYVFSFSMLCWITRLKSGSVRQPFTNSSSSRLPLPAEMQRSEMMMERIKPHHLRPKLRRSSWHASLTRSWEHPPCHKMCR